MASLFDNYTPKAQIDNMYEGEKQAIKKAKAILQQKGLQWDFAQILAEDLIPKIIGTRKAAVAKSAPSIDLGVAKVVESMLLDFEVLVDKMDENDELEKLLNALVLKEQRAKYDF
jgi:hypothetical protein